MFDFQRKKYVFMRVVAFRKRLTALLMGGFSLLLGNGILQKKLVSHYYEYARKLGAAEFFSIQDFATRLGCSEKVLR